MCLSLGLIACVFSPGEVLRREWQYTKKFRNEEEQISDSNFDMVHREVLRDLFPGDWVTVVNSYKELCAWHTPGPFKLLLFLLLLPFLHHVQGAGTAVF